MQKDLKNQNQNYTWPSKPKCGQLSDQRDTCSPCSTIESCALNSQLPSDSVYHRSYRDTF